MRTVDEITNDIYRVERMLFYEEMADFMNWNKYRKLNEQLRELEKELSEAEKNGSV